MPNSALAGWLAFFLLLSFVYSEGVTGVFGARYLDPDSKGCDAHAQQRDANNGAAPVEKDAPPGEEKQGGRDSAYCVQWRTAIATERQTSYTRLGLWLVGLTLLATGGAAVAAWQTVRTMRETAKRELRSYVFINPLGLELRENFGIGGIRLEIKNSGHTPAHGLSIHFIVKMLPAQLPESFDPLLEDLGPSGIVLGPQSAIFPPMQVRRIATENEIADMRTDTRALYVFVAVHYSDVFGERHGTKICMSADNKSLMHAFEQATQEKEAMKGGEGLWLLHPQLCSAD